MLTNIEDFIQLLLEEYFFVMVYIIVLLERLKRIANRNLFLSWFINLSGTILHELSHFIVALITFGKPTTFSLIPKSTRIVENGLERKIYELGSVSVRNANNFNRFPIGMSPLLLLIPLLYIDNYFFIYFENTLKNTLLYLFIVIVILDSSIPSGQDFKQAFKGYGYIIWLLILLFIAFALQEPSFINSIIERILK